MNIAFLENEPLNDVIVDDANQRPLYEVRTPWKLGGRTTSIRRAASDGSGELVAEIQTHPLSSNTISFMGSPMKVDQFLRKESFWKSARIFTGTDGKSYKWKRKLSAFKLYDVQTNTIVAQSHRRKFGLFSTPRRMNVDIFPQGLQMLDAIVVSFIIMEEERRQEENQAAAAAAAG